MADKSAVGKTGKPFKMHVDWSKVREFARAIKDPNPLYFDPELAKKEVGGVPVPVTFLQTSAFWTDETSSPGFGGFDLRRILHGEQEFEFFKPIFVGDTLTGVTKVADVLEEGRRPRRQDDVADHGNRVHQPEGRESRDCALDPDRNRTSSQSLTHSR